MPSDGKMACVMTPAGLRLAGQVELAGLDAVPNWRRAEVLLKFAREVFPQLPAICRRNVSSCGWATGLDADGLPVLGLASGCSDIIHAFGHGHVGLTAAATTGKVVADLVAGRPPPFDLTAYSATRFRSPKPLRIGFSCAPSVAVEPCQSCLRQRMRMTVKPTMAAEVFTSESSLSTSTAKIVK